MTRFEEHKRLRFQEAKSRGLWRQVDWVLQEVTDGMRPSDLTPWDVPFSITKEVEALVHDRIMVADCRRVWATVMLERANQ